LCTRRRRESSDMAPSRKSRSTYSPPWTSWTALSLEIFFPSTFGTVNVNTLDAMGDRIYRDRWFVTGIVLEFLLKNIPVEVYVDWHDEKNYEAYYRGKTPKNKFTVKLFPPASFDSKNGEFIEVNIIFEGDQVEDNYYAFRLILQVFTAKMSWNCPKQSDKSSLRGSQSNGRTNCDTYSNYNLIINDEQ
jgi:hypothetical protein